MAKVKAEQKSELQKAADRVREIQTAIEVREEHLAVCKREVAQCKLVYDEACRNFEDTKGLLNAQRDKLMREIESVRILVGYGEQTVGYARANVDMQSN